MLRLSLLAVSLLALAASTFDTSQFRQRGTVAAPRAALHDGQPLGARIRVEGHAGTLAGEDQPVTSAGPATESGAAIAGKQAGGAIRLRAGESPVDFGLELDTAWSPSSTTRDGVRVAAPDEHVFDFAVAMRTSTRVSETNDMRIGFVANLGGHSVPIVRGDDPTGDVQRDNALLFRAAIVPSYRSGTVTFFGSLGLASQTDVPSNVTRGDGDPGVVAESSGAAFTLAAGASVELGNGARATARVGDAFTDDEMGHYGPQVDVGLSFDFDR